jgi:hypothetical protein
VRGTHWPLLRILQQQGGAHNQQGMPGAPGRAAFPLKHACVMGLNDTGGLGTDSKSQAAAMAAACTAKQRKEWPGVASLHSGMEASQLNSRASRGRADGLNSACLLCKQWIASGARSIRHAVG